MACEYWTSATRCDFVLTQTLYLIVQEHLPCWCGDKDEDGPCVYCDEFGCKRLMHGTRSFLHGHRPIADSI